MEHNPFLPEPGGTQIDQIPLGSLGFLSAPLVLLFSSERTQPLGHPQPPSFFGDFQRRCTKDACIPSHLLGVRQHTAVRPPPVPRAFKRICAISYELRSLTSEPLAPNCFSNMSLRPLGLTVAPRLPPSLGVLMVASGMRDNPQSQPSALCLPCSSPGA